MVIQIDTREKPKAIEKILAEFDRSGVQYIRSKLPFGDYMNLDNPKLYIDRKQNLLEVCNNLVQDRDRFVRELESCAKCGCSMIILVENGGSIKQLSDVINWVNPRLKESPMAVSGRRLHEKMFKMERYYGFRWEFCTKAETGMRIIELLGGNDG